MKLWPARTKAMQEDPVTDLDAILSKSVSFRFKGKIHTLKPFSLEEFLAFTNAQSKLLSALGEPDAPITSDELAERYHKVISSVCSTITIKDIKSMAQVQIAALYQLVIDLVTGQVDMGDGKKKRQKVDIYGSAQASSSQSAPGSLDGSQAKR